MTSVKTGKNIGENPQAGKNKKSAKPAKGRKSAKSFAVYGVRTQRSKAPLIIR
jgi:hypothetical protein